MGCQRIKLFLSKKFTHVGLYMYMYKITSYFWIGKDCNNVDDGEISVDVCIKEDCKQKANVVHELITSC